MALVPIQRGIIVQGLMRLFGLKGQLESHVDSTVLPTVSVGNLVDSPYLQYGSAMGKSGLSAAVAAEFSCVVARPSATVALQVKEILIRNPTAAALDGVLTILTAANIATAGLTAFANFVDMSQAPAGESRSSDLARGSHTSIVGSEVGRFTVPADNMVSIVFPEPGVILYGNDDGGIPGFGIWCEVANTQLEAVTIYAREWPLPA